jgi:hypothetical protein
MKPHLFCLLIFLSPADVRSEDHYRVVFSDDLETVSVDACFDGEAPREFYRHENADSHIRFLEADGVRIDPESKYGRIRLPRMPADSCLRWQVALGSAAGSDWRLSARVEGGFLTDGSLWFWRDTDRRAIRIAVDLPPGATISTPWQERPGPGKPIFSPAPTPPQWTFRIAIGRFPVQRIEVPGGVLRLSAVGGLDAVQRDRFAEWIAENARSVASVHGRFPVSETQILVVPVGPRDSAVPFGRVVRGGGAGIEFFVDESRSLDDLRADWTAAHELSHLLLPFVASPDRWLSEGLASYYQNVLRARDGRLTEEQAWRNLDDGFERGRSATRAGESLASATRSGRDGIMRVYWSGAAILLEADTRLRALSGGSQSLDTVLAGLSECCLDSTRGWRAKELFEQFDRLTGLQVFSPLYRRHVHDADFPDLGRTLDYLGVETETAADTVVLIAEAHGSEIRAAIMRGRRDG